MSMFISMCFDGMYLNLAIPGFLGRTTHSSILGPEFGASQVYRASDSSSPHGRFQKPGFLSEGFRAPLNGFGDDIGHEDLYLHVHIYIYTHTYIYIYYFVSILGTRIHIYIKISIFVFTSIFISIST